MNILHSSHCWLPRTQTWMYNQIRALNRHCKNFIAVERTRNLDQFLLPDVYCLTKEYPVRYILDKMQYAMNLRKNLSSLTHLAKKLNINILHTHFADYGYVNIETAKQCGLRHIVTFYGYDVSMLPQQKPSWKQRYQELFQTADLFLCEGPFMAEAVSRLGCPKEKIKVHHIGVLVDDIPFKPRTWNPSESLRILITANFVEKKGIPYAIEALHKVSKKIPLMVTIIGDSSPTASSRLEKKKILNLISKLKMDSKITLLGYQPYKRMIEESYKHHLYLCASVTAENGDTEGGAPVTLLEMMASGIPVIGTRHCDIPNIINHSKNGFLAAERRTDDLARQILWFVENHKSENWNKITQAARLTVERDFSVNVQANKLLKIYEQLLK